MVGQGKTYNRFLNIHCLHMYENKSLSLNEAT